MSKAEELRIGMGQSSTLESNTETMVELPDGTAVPLSELGEPPADLPHDQLESWLMGQAEKLMTQGYIELETTHEPI